MTFLELQNLILDWLDDPNAGYFTLAKVKQWINNAQKEVQKRLLQAGENWYLTCEQTTTVANQSDYALPDDFLKSHRVCIVTSPGTTSEVERELQPITLNQQDLVINQPGEPECFFLKKARMVLVPKPDQAYTLRLYYSYRVADMTIDTETPDAPEQYHELIAVEGALNGFIKDARDPSVLLAKKKEYEKLFERDAENRVEDTPREVVVTDDF
jgi:hypothetical protein